MGHHPHRAARAVSLSSRMTKDIFIKEGDRLIVEPVQKPETLAELLAIWEPAAEEFPEIEDPPVRPQDIF